MQNKDQDTHPIQLPQIIQGRIAGKLSKAVTMRAYEVYCHVNGPQEALVEGWCRGGFHISELLTFLYARSFPKEEWSDRVREAEQGMYLGDRNE